MATTLAELREYIAWLERWASGDEVSEAIRRGDGPGISKLRLIVGELRERAADVPPVLTLIKGGRNV